MTLNSDEIIVISSFGITLLLMIVFFTLTGFRYSSLLLFSLILGSLGAVFYGLYEDKGKWWWIVPVIIISLSLVAIILQFFRYNNKKNITLDEAKIILNRLYEEKGIEIKDEPEKNQTRVHIIDADSQIYQAIHNREKSYEYVLKNVFPEGGVTDSREYFRIIIRDLLKSRDYPQDLKDKYIN